MKLLIVDGVEILHSLSFKIKLQLFYSL